MSGLDQYVKLMGHMDDIGLVDSYGGQSAPTLSGNTARSDTESKFGGYSANFPADVDYLSYPASVDFFFDADFTIDFWFHGGFGGARGLFGTGLSGDNPKMHCWHESDYMIIHKNGNPGGQWTVSWPWSPISNEWVHCAIVRNGSSWYLFINGVITGGVQTEAGVLLDSGQPLRIGSDGEGAKHFTGYIEEFRISKGIARWTSNFTPPTEPYSEFTLIISGVDSPAKVNGIAAANIANVSGM